MLKYRILLCILLIGTLAKAQSFKPVADPGKIFADLKKASQTAQSIQADFREEKSLAVLNKPESSSGTFYYKKSDRMRWEQQKPISYVILINGDKLRVKEAGKEKNVAAAGRMAAQIKELMIGLVNGDFQENKAFSQTCMESTDAYQVQLTPVSNRLKRIYSKITLVFPKSTLRLRELTFLEKNGDKSVMTFSNEKINQVIPETVFNQL